MRSCSGGKGLNGNPCHAAAVVSRADCGGAGQARERTTSARPWSSMRLHRERGPELLGSRRVVPGARHQGHVRAASEITKPGSEDLHKHCGGGDEVHQGLQNVAELCRRRASQRTKHVYLALACPVLQAAINSLIVSEGGVGSDDRRRGERWKGRFHIKKATWAWWRQGKDKHGEQQQTLVIKFIDDTGFDSSNHRNISIWKDIGLDVEAYAARKRINRSNSCMLRHPTSINTWPLNLLRRRPLLMSPE